jgi:cation:H+ antiporter
MAGASLLMAMLALAGPLGGTAGLVLLGGLVVSTSVSAREALRTRLGQDTTTPLEWVLGVPSTLPMIGLFVAAGLVGLPLGARLVIDGAVELAGALGVTNTVVGLTIVAASTSLPELATTVTAAVQRRTELVLGTVLGSNIFNLLGIMGASALVSPEAIPVAGRARMLDLPIMLATALLLAALVFRGRPVGRKSGIVLLGGYLAYLLSFA